MKSISLEYALVDKKSSAEYYLDEIRRIWDHEFQSSFSYLR